MSSSHPVAGVVEGWTFHVHEVSAGVFRVEGQHSSGSKVSRSGEDADALLRLCANDARELQARGDGGQKR